MQMRKLSSYCALVFLSIGMAYGAKPAKTEQIYLGIEQAVQRYQHAQDDYQVGSDSALALMNQSLEDLEDLSNQCLQLKNCSHTKVISAYERLVKEHDIVNISDTNLNTVASVLPALGSTVKLLGNKNLELLVQLNEPVQAAMARWLSSQRSYFIDAWVSYQYMRYLMAPEYEAAGLPEALLFGMMVQESGGKVHSVSKAGATGPLQFMFNTGRQYGLDNRIGYDMRYDPQFAARANAAYMNARFQELNNSLEMAIASYNGGDGRARRIKSQTGDADFWSERVYKEWPAESRDYVPNVIAAAWLFLHAKDYGLNLPHIDTTPSQFSLQRPSSINELSICLGNTSGHEGWFRVLRNLNPGFEPTQVIAQGTVLRAPKKLVDSYPVNCLSGPRADLAHALSQASKQPVFSTPAPESIASTDTADVLAVAPVNAPEKHGMNYRVQEGETLMSIMRKFDCSLSHLIRENQLDAPDYRIYPNQMIRLVSCKK